MSSVPKRSKRLKPCKKCGGQAFVYIEPVGMQEDYRGRWREVNKYYAECQDCGKMTRPYKSKQKMIDAWNRG